VKALLLAALALAALPAGEAARLDELRREIRALDERAARAGGREESLAGEVQRLDRLAELHRRELEMLALRMEGVEQRVSRSSERMGQVEQDLARFRPAVLALRDSMGRVGRMGYLVGLLGRPASEGFPTAVRQAGYLADRYRARLRAAEQRLADLRGIRGQLESSRREFARLQGEAEAAQLDLQRTRSTKAALLDRVRVEKREAEALRSELARAAEKLQALVKGFPEAAGFPAVPVRLYRGEMEWPVRGSVTQEFGRVRGTEREIPYAGMDIWAPVGTAVRAVAAGRVVYADWFQGYGKTVCLDHGEGYITVYAHVSEILAGKGASVARGEVIALVGDTGSLKGPGLYFQISKDGKPEDPRDWLAPVEAAARKRPAAPGAKGRRSPTS